MTNHRSRLTGASGFTLIEALIALAVFSFGLLAVAKFQAALVSSSTQSKARSEAVQLAQQKIDEIRKYATEPELVANLLAKAVVNTDKFSTVLPNTTTPFLPITTAANYSTADDASIIGNNAEYARNWDVVCVASTSCSVVVHVSWTDQLGDFQTASLETRVVFKDPRSSADLSLNNFTPLVPSATGRAYLGSGTVTQAQLDGGTSNNDGTVEVTEVNGGKDRVLVDASAANDDGTYNIILTLDDACSATGGVTTCTDFVKISGKVYRDNVAAPVNTLADIYVLASDAAYCARDLSNTVTTATGNYSYYPYTCYLGGGWHGNIGLTLTSTAANTSKDHVCLGDPNSPPETPVALDDGIGTNNWHAVEAASRRVYRGVTYIGDDTTVVDTSTLFYSQGIGDAVVLPDSGDYVGGVFVPGTDFRNYGHDYVLTKINATPTAIDCIPALTRPDSDTDGDALLPGGEVGDIFYRVATDFVCLNIDNNPTGSDYLDTLRLGHMDPEDCPYDPSRGPALGWYVEGTVSVPGPDVLDGTEILNSTNPANCKFVTDFVSRTPIDDISGLSSVKYSCIVYDWGSGWSGSVYVTEGFGLDCDPAIPLTVTANVTGQNFNCETKLQPEIRGTIKAYFKDLTGTTIEAVRNNTDGTTSVIPCTPSNGGGDTINFSCVVEEEVLNGGWIGTVTLTEASGITCDTTSWSWPGIAPTLTAATYDTGTTYCRDPLVSSTLSVTVTGTITATDGGDLSTGGGITPSGSTTAGVSSACSLVGYTDAPANTTATYECVQSFAYNSTGWSGSVNLTLPTGVYCSPTTHSLSNVTANNSWPLTSCTVARAIIIQGAIADLATPNDNVWDLNTPFITVTDDIKGQVAGYGTGCTAWWIDYALNDHVGYRCTMMGYTSTELLNGSITLHPDPSRKICTQAVTDLVNIEPGSIVTLIFAVVNAGDVCPILPAISVTPPP